MAHTFMEQVGDGRAPVKTVDPQRRAWRLRHRPEFWLMHHPTAWEAIEIELPQLDKDGEPTGETAPEVVWLPKLKQIKAAPGANGVRQTKHGIDVSLAFANFDRRGWVRIPRDVMGPGTDYCKEVDTRGGGVTHMLWCEAPIDMGNTDDIECDEDKWNQFRLWLVTSGQIAPPKPHHLRRAFELLDRRIKRWEKEVHIPAVARTVQAAEKKRAAMQAAAEAL